MHGTTRRSWSFGRCAVHNYHFADYLHRLAKEKRLNPAFEMFFLRAFSLTSKGYFYLLVKLVKGDWVVRDRNTDCF